MRGGGWEDSTRGRISLHLRLYLQWITMAMDLQSFLPADMLTLHSRKSHVLLMNTRLGSIPLIPCEIECKQEAAEWNHLSFISLFTLVFFMLPQVIIIKTNNHNNGYKGQYGPCMKNYSLAIVLMYNEQCHLGVSSDLIVLMHSNLIKVM